MMCNLETRMTVSLLVLVCALCARQTSAQQLPISDAQLREYSTPLALDHADRITGAENVPLTQVAEVDLKAVAEEDEQRKTEGLPQRFAIANQVSLTAKSAGQWELLDNDMAVWRLRVGSENAKSLNLGFSKYYMPQHGRMFIYSADLKHIQGPFTNADNAEHGELWTPVILGNEAIIEVSLPAGSKDELGLELTSINVGYRFFGEEEDLRSGSCNIDVVCPQGDSWRDEIPAVGVYTVSGVWTCSGSLVNNTAQDQTPYFLTAYHCSVTSSNDQSVVVYWNFETSICGEEPDGSLDNYQTGTIFRAAYSSSDFTLLEMEEDPDPGLGLTYVGWDRSGTDATSAVGIHHPNTDEKRISLENDPTTTTSYYGTSTPGNGTHVRITDWDLGTTEGGSSGSPLFNQNHHVIGQLHGGDAACGNNESDWYGKFSVSWTGGGTSSSRLSDWLDPLASGAVTLDTFNPWAIGIKVTPAGDLDASGDPGGPFSPASIAYTLQNQGTSPISYSITATASWISITNATGNLAAGATTIATVSINSNADSLGVGEYSDTISFINNTNHEGDTTRSVDLQVGGPQLVHSFTFDSDPGWTTQGDWGFGEPTGQGGDYGYADPDSGYTGSNVYGYNLNGDYSSGMVERHLTSTAVDCSTLQDTTLVFYRWLGVERSRFDHAYVRVSNNGTNWTTIWSNPDSHIEDSSWSRQEYDISATADGQATVYLRWTMGSTDDSWQFCGWNIDDVEIWGTATSTCYDGILNQGETRIDCGGPCPACECTVDSSCSDNQYCTGIETCNAFGQCAAGQQPCTGAQWCYEDEDSCMNYGTSDCDSDGDVDLDDFALFQICFGELGIGPCEAANLNGDGLIDLNDYTALANDLVGPQ